MGTVGWWELEPLPAGAPSWWLGVVACGKQGKALDAAVVEAVAVVCGHGSPGQGWIAVMPEFGNGQTPAETSRRNTQSKGGEQRTSRPSCAPRSASPWLITLTLAVRGFSKATLPR